MVFAGSTLTMQVQLGSPQSHAAASHFHCDKLGGGGGGGGGGGKGPCAPGKFKYQKVGAKLY